MHRLLQRPIFPIEGPVDPSRPGTYPITYRATDPVGNVGEGHREVVVEDTTPPSITCPPPKTAECVNGVAVVDPGPALAVDACGLAFVSPNAPAIFPIGTSSVGYAATDFAGHTTMCSTDVTVNDSVPPRVDLVGNASPVLECGVDMYIEQGAVAADICYGDITSRIIWFGNVNSHAEGLYTVDYSATDPSGNPSPIVRRSVLVKDRLAPAITLAGQGATPSDPMTLECGADTYSEPGASVDDACYGNLSESLTITNSVNTAIEGDYTVNYSVADPAQNAATAPRFVKVKDTRRPTIILLGGGDTVRIRCDKAAPPWVDPGAVATDSCYGDLSSQIIKHGTVDTRTPGSYQIVYEVTDGAGLITTVTRTVNVVADPPQIVARPSPELWPPDHGMRSFRLSDCAAVTVTCGPSLDLDQNGRITRLSSDEPEDAWGSGDGDTLEDIVISGPSSFQLRSERQGGGTGRAYGVDFDVLDNSGATLNYGFCRFLVPHDGSGSPVTDEGPSSGYTVYR